jgi:hypothetical protein
MNIYEKLRIFRSATYIDTVLRPKLSALSGERSVLGWESFLNTSYKLSMRSRLLSKVRMTIFLIPSLLMTALYIKYSWHYFVLWPPNAYIRMALLASTLCGTVVYLYAFQTVTYTYMHANALKILRNRGDLR